MRTAAQRVGVQVGGLPLEAEEQGAAAIARDPRHAGAVQHPQEHVQNRFDLENRIFGTIRESGNDLGPGRGTSAGGGTRPGPFRLIRGGAA